MVDEKNFAQLADPDLKEANGGFGPGNEKFVMGKKDLPVGSYDIDGVSYWPCPKCGRPTYKEWASYHCDPCNDWYSLFTIKYTPWKGTKQELIDAAG